MGQRCGLLKVDWFGVRTDVFNMSNWTIPGRMNYLEMSKIVHAIIHNHHLDYLEHILCSGWDVNEILYIPDHRASTALYSRPTLRRHYIQRTALHQAVYVGWTEGVKMLLGAGAKCNVDDKLENVLVLALPNRGIRPPELIELLLKHGADPNQHTTDEDIPLLNAISTCSLNTVQLLLEHGANPNVSGMVYTRHGLSTRPANNSHVSNPRTGGFVYKEDSCTIETTALLLAEYRKWIEGVKLLIGAGAKCKTDDLHRLVTLATDSYDSDLIKLLIKHGCADFKLISKSLLTAIKMCGYTRNGTETVELLLEFGADPNVMTYENFVYNWPLSAALDQGSEVFFPLFKTFVKFGADVNVNVIGKMPLLHRTVTLDTNMCCHFRLLQEQLDLFYQHGGNINMADVRNKTALEYAVTKPATSNIIRWLIRHGADTSFMKLSLLKHHFMGDGQSVFYPDTTLVLLQAGMRVSHEAQRQLGIMEMYLCTENVPESLWETMVSIENKEHRRKQYLFKKSTFHLTRQMADLREFSDYSLQVYCEFEESKSQSRQNCIDEIHKILQFLSQPQSLQWHCRRCVRESLMSLQTLLVKTLPIPTALKRYILCHEV